MQSNVVGIVLAGGLSRRMGGGDKGMIPIGGMPLMARVINRLTTQLDNIAINANGDPNRFAAYNLPIIADTISGFAGPLAGVLSGLQYAQRAGADGIISVAADTPFFPQNLSERLLAASQGGSQIVLAETDGHRHPTFGYWPVKLADDLADWLSEPDNRKVLAWVQKHDWTTVDFPMNSNGNDPFFNVNTPEDVARAQEMLNTDTQKEA